MSPGMFGKHSNTKPWRTCILLIHRSNTIFSKWKQFLSKCFELSFFVIFYLTCKTSALVRIFKLGVWTHLIRCLNGSSLGSVLKSGFFKFCSPLFLKFVAHQNCWICQKAKTGDLQIIMVFAKRFRLFLILIYLFF